MIDAQPPIAGRSLLLACITTATFTDLVAYSVAAPVLPDYATKFNASPTTIGMLFASFGIGVITFSIPMGAVSDRIGRKGPMVGGLVVLAISTLLFAYSSSLPMLFVARTLQGVADVVTWVVGFALIADLYADAERGRAMGLAMGGSTLGVIAGPLLGGWLYELGGVRLPFLVVTALVVLDLVVFIFASPPAAKRSAETGSIANVFRVRAIVICALIVVAGSATGGMLEPVMPLFLESKLGLGPASIGTIFGTAAIASSAMHPLYGRLSDRWGGRRLMLTGLAGLALMLPVLNFASDFRSAALVMVPTWMAFGMFITPSLAYFAQLAAGAGVHAYGVVYGLYNLAWAIGLMIGPAVGGFFLERAGFGKLTLGWSVVLLGTSAVLARLR